MNEESYSTRGVTTFVVGPGDHPQEAGIPANSPATSRDIPLCSEKIPWLLRAVEVFIAASVLLLTLPIMLVMAWLIRRGTPGKALFFQTRVGLNQRPFKFVKFRTLYADAKQRFPQLYAYKYGPRELETLKFKMTDDPRVTPQGKWMRN